MKRLSVIIILLLCLLLSGCSLLKKQNKAVALSVPTESTITSFGEKTKYDFSVEKVVHREDGFFEVYYKRIDKTTDEEVGFRYLYSSDGMPIGTRDLSTNQDSIELFDTSFASYQASIEDKIDRIKENRIYLEDGGYEDLDLEGDRILRIQTYSEDGTKLTDFQMNECGQLESLILYDNNEEAYLKIRITYQTITPNE